MQKQFRKVVEQTRKLHSLSKLSIKLGLALMFIFYIIALVAKLYAPYAEEYFETLSVYRGCLAAAPAFLAVGATAGLLGDLVLRSGRTDDPED